MITAEPGTKTKLLDATLGIVRAKGYTATTVDDVCRAAGVTKGSFFYYFKSKEDLALAAADHFLGMAGGLFAAAPYRSHADPLDRVLGYIEFRASILKGELPEFTCLLGTMVQETYQTHPAIKAACERGIFGHAAEVARDIALAKEKYAADATWTAESLANFTQSVLQGAFVLAKARGGPDVAVESVEHLMRYVEMLFTPGRR